MHRGILRGRPWHTGQHREMDRVFRKQEAFIQLRLVELDKITEREHKNGERQGNN